MEPPLLIAIVDDDPSVCKALSRLLRASHMDVETYTSGTEFLRAWGPPHPDCLILDIRMPAMTGPEIRQRLLDTGHRVPIVFITAHAEDVVSETQLRTEGVDVLRKPFDNEELLDAIQQAIHRQERP